MKNILSVDWDYFFPCTVDNYGWYAFEEHKYFQKVWQNRFNSKRPYHKKNAYTEFVPDLKRLNNFWSYFNFKSNVKLVIAESHAELIHIIKKYKIVNKLYNFDAHHDYTYDYFAPKNIKNVDCGSWGKFALDHNWLKQYHIIYPKWRKKDIEYIECENYEYIEDVDKRRIKVHYNVPQKQLANIKFDVIFICRSYAWSPPWSDKLWIDFINYWKKHNYEV